MGYTCSSTCQWSQHHSLRGVGRWTWSTINWKFRHHDKWTHAIMWVQIAFPNFQGSLKMWFSFNNMHFCFFSLPSTWLDDAGWLSPSHSYGQPGDVERSDHHVVGAIHHHVASFQSRPMLRKIEPSPSRHGRWCHATNTCLFFKLFLFLNTAWGSQHALRR